MQLLVLILNKMECLSKLLLTFRDNGIKTTILDCKGISETLGAKNVEPPPIFGSLRNYLNHNHEDSKMLLMILPSEEVKSAKELIEGVLGEIENPDTGIIFTIGLTSVEGLER